MCKCVDTCSRHSAGARAAMVVLCLSGLFAGPSVGMAQSQINIEFRPVSSNVPVGADERIGVYLVSSTGETDELTSAASIMVGWDRTVLRLLNPPVDQTGAAQLLSSGFPGDNGDVNEVVPPQDGDGYYSAFARLGQPVACTPAGTLITTLRFQSLAGACGGTT